MPADIEVVYQDGYETVVEMDEVSIKTENFEDFKKEIENLVARYQI